jgi:hypothetical protein
MFVPSEAEETLTLTIAFADGRTEDVTTTTPQEYLAGEGYRIVVSFKKIEISTTVVKLDGLFNLWTDHGEEDDIDEDKQTETVTFQTPTNVEDQLSNAYLVAPGGTVRFKVSRAYTLDEQNEGKFTNTLRAYNTEFTGAFDIATVWADTENLIETPTVTGSGKNAVVAVKAKSGVSGNAVVAIKKTGTSEIVWSYHIWVTGYNPEDPDYQYTNSNNGVVFMDRNLGAKEAGLGSGLGTGLFYQWGRKDPFPATGSVTTAATSLSNGTIANTIKNPATFITSSADPYDWYYGGTRNNELWGNNDLKTIYDPCPAGWRVPVNPSSSADTSPWVGFTKDNGGTFSSGYNWGTNAVYPAAGYRTRDTGAISSGIGTRGLYWSAALSGIDALYLNLTNITVDLVNTSSRAAGFTVRYVQE